MEANIVLKFPTHTSQWKVTVRLIKIEVPYPAEPRVVCTFQPSTIDMRWGKEKDEEPLPHGYNETVN